MALDESKTEEDNVHENFGVTVVADNRFNQFLEGAVVDYIDSEYGGGFEIRTARKSDCSSGCASGGCGSAE